MNQAEIDQITEEIARGEPCTSCGKPWEGPFGGPCELVHEPWCEYLAHTSPEHHTVEWIDEVNHARVHVAAHWPHPEDHATWYHEIVVVDRDEMADYNHGTRIVLERWLAEEQERERDPERFTREAEVDLYNQLLDHGINTLEVQKDAGVNAWLDVLRCFITLGPDVTHDGDHYGGPYWVRSRPDGTLMLAVFPQGDTYEMISQREQV